MTMRFAAALSNPLQMQRMKTIVRQRDSLSMQSLNVNKRVDLELKYVKINVLIANYTLKFYVILKFGKGASKNIRGFLNAILKWLMLKIHRKMESGRWRLEERQNEVLRVHLFQTISEIGNQLIKEIVKKIASRLAGSSSVFDCT